MKAIFKIKLTQNKPKVRVDKLYIVVRSCKVITKIHRALKVRVLPYQMLMDSQQVSMMLTSIINLTTNKTSDQAIITRQIINSKKKEIPHKSQSDRGFKISPILMTLNSM